jgi:hypothetical protein
MSLSTAMGNSILDMLLNQTNITAPTAIWLSLHTADPGTTGASEGVDATYARINVTTAFPAASSRSCSNNVVIEFAALTTGETYTHAGLWSAATSGTYYDSADISPDKAVGAGEIPRFASGTLTFTAA